MLLKIIQLLIVTIFRQKQQINYYQLFYLYFFLKNFWITHKNLITNIHSSLFIYFTLPRRTTFPFLFFFSFFLILPGRTTFPKIHGFFVTIK